MDSSAAESLVGVGIIIGIIISSVACSFIMLGAEVIPEKDGTYVYETSNGVFKEFKVTTKTTVELGEINAEN